MNNQLINRHLCDITRGPPPLWSSMVRGKIRPAILQNPGMDTFRPTGPLSPRKDTLILLWPWTFVKMSFIGKIDLQFKHYSWHLINRPGVAGAVIQSPLSFINWLIQWSFSSNIFQTLPITNRHLSRVTCHLSRVTFFILYKKLDKVVELVGGHWSFVLLYFRWKRQSDPCTWFNAVQNLALRWLKALRQALDQYQNLELAPWVFF